ncbi:MAG: hypothetical protein H0V17_04920 [Deltaproteobacteria bacterium]|nr:hypothetical protein [Deltaproteobacteria bacterium]
MAPPPGVKPGRFPTRTQDVNVTISGSRIVANGVEISGTPQLVDFQNVYGKPDRVWDTKGGVNRVHTWDKLGFVVYEPMDGRAISATFPFKPMAMAYDPTTMFGGSIIVDGYALNGTSDLADIKTRPGATQPYSATSVVFPKGDFNVFLTGRNGPIDLVELSMWKKGGAAAPVVTAGGGKYSNTKDIKIVITGTSVSLNGVAITGKPYLKDIEAIYGKPDRVWDQGGANRIHTYDKLGMVLYEPRDGRVISTTFPYRALGGTYDPSTMFGGSITVDGRAMPSTIDLGTIKSRPGAGQPYGADSIVFDKGDIHVFTIAKAGAKTIDLVEISYWQKDKASPVAPVPAENPSGGKASEIKVEVTSAGAVTLNGKAIGGKPMLADIKKIIGEPSRVWDKKGGANRIHTWDDLGLVVYEPYNGRAISLTMPYKTMGSDFSPKTLFKGRVSLDSRGFYNFNTVGTIKDRKGATQPYGADSVVFDFGDIHVFVKAAKATVETLDLVEVSFWQKNK